MITRGRHHTDNSTLIQTSAAAHRNGKKKRGNAVEHENFLVASAYAGGVVAGSDDRAGERMSGVSRNF